jgi:hypothetical protein
MSENLNPTRCGNCGTDNPPGQEFCVGCGQPLTLAADAAVLAETPETVDDPRQYDQTNVGAPAEVPVMGGLGGAPLLMPAESVAPELDEQPSD